MNNKKIKRVKDLKKIIDKVLLPNYIYKTNFNSSDFLIDINYNIIIKAKLIKKDNKMVYEFVIDTQFMSEAEITYDEIANSTKPLESKLRNLINTLYQGPLNNKVTLDKISDAWQKEEAHKQKIHEEVLKDEEIRAQKQKELEDFLNSW